MSTLVYNEGKEQMLNGGVDLDTHTVKLLLVGTGYSEDPDHDFVSDLVAEECVGTNYSRKTLTVTLIRDDSNDRVVADVDDVTFTELGADVGTVYGVVIFKETGDDGTAPLIYFGKFATPYVSNGSDLVIVFAALGIFYI